MIYVRNLILIGSYARPDRLTFSLSSKMVECTFDVYDGIDIVFSSKLGKIDIFKRATEVITVKRADLSEPPQVVSDGDSWLLIGDGAGAWNGYFDCVMVAKIHEEQIYWSSWSTNSPIMVESDGQYYRSYIEGGKTKYKTITPSVVFTHEQWESYFGETALAQINGNLSLACARLVCDLYGLNKDTDIQIIDA